MAKSWVHRPSSPPTKQCPSCGKWIHSRSRKCPACETVLADTASASGDTASGARKRIVRKKKVKRRTARTPARQAARNGSSIEAAIQFVQAAGGLDQARQALATLERIRSL